mmetsp:Transcript_13351/g.40384  ORF Transcript_13351/g.40384 Transcript_13351/m.40384 type:complete len:146 (-) Transcript_13351:244-681(-)
MECVQYVVWAMLVECFLMMLTNHGEPDHALQNWYNQYVANKTRAESQTHYPMYTHTNSCKNKNAKQYSAMAFCGTGAGWIVLPSVTFILKHNVSTAKPTLFARPASSELKGKDDVSATYSSCNNAETTPKTTHASHAFAIAGVCL